MKHVIDAYDPLTCLHTNVPMVHTRRVGDTTLVRVANGYSPEFPVPARCGPITTAIQHISDNWLASHELSAFEPFEPLLQWLGPELQRIGRHYLEGIELDTPTGRVDARHTLSGALTLFALEGELAHVSWCDNAWILHLGADGSLKWSSRSHTPWNMEMDDGVEDDSDTLAEHLTRYHLMTNTMLGTRELPHNARHARLDLEPGDTLLYVIRGTTEYLSIAGLVGLVAELRDDTAEAIARRLEPLFRPERPPLVVSIRIEDP